MMTKKYLKCKRKKKYDKDIVVLIVINAHTFLAVQPLT